jgi:hypothetical protein
MTVRPSRSEASMSRVAGNRNSREVAERGDEAGDRSSRSGGETHRDLADAFVLWGQRRRYGLFLRLTARRTTRALGRRCRGLPAQAVFVRLPGIADCQL